MNKSVLSVLAAVSLFLVPSLSQAQTPLDYYKVGQFLGSTRFAQNLMSYTKKSDLKAKMDVERRLLVQLGAPSPVLVSYDHMANSLSNLPIKTAYASWTTEQQNDYINSSVDFTTINAWLPAGDTQPRFYFWLGYQTQYLAKDGPLEMTTWNDAQTGVQANYKSSLSDIAAFASSYPISFKTALPDIQAAMTAIAPYSGKTIAAADATAIQQQAMIIYTDANGKVAQ